MKRGGGGGGAKFKNELLLFQTLHINGDVYFNF